MALRLKGGVLGRRSLGHYTNVPPLTYEGLLPPPDRRVNDHWQSTISAAGWSLPTTDLTQVAGQSVAGPSQTPDDPYDFLRAFDTILLTDDSGSMSGPNWHEARNALARITPICTSNDADGMTFTSLTTRKAIQMSRRRLLWNGNSRMCGRQKRHPRAKD